jgi:hypothetical protein
VRSLLIVFAGTGLLIGAPSEWVGSRACHACHASIYAMYMRTPMATSSGVVGDGRRREHFNNATFEHSSSGYRYRVRQRSGAYDLQWQKTSDGAAAWFTKPMPFYVGSGSLARSYLLESNGFLYQSPVAYYATTAKWDLAPGYARYNQPFVTRPILPGCLQCHASGVQHLPLTQNQYAARPFEEGGVSCERCHGPGANHIAAMRSGRKSDDKHIVNPSKLAPERRDSVCAQCHLTGEARVVRAGRSVESFRAGERLQDHVEVLARAGTAGEMRVTSHVENLAQSACKQASGDRLWCGTCHDPHTLPSPAARVTWYRAKCLSCHQVETCKAPSPARTANGDDCTSCHMPKNSVTDAQHVVYTDHSIPRTPRSETPRVDGIIRLARFGAGNADDRELGLGYAILAQREPNAAYRDRAFELLRSARRKQQADAEVLLYLADLHNQRSQREEAIKLYEEAIRLDPSQLTGSVTLGAIRMEQGNYTEAIRLWNDALSKNPALMLVRGNLAAALLKTGSRAEAEAVLSRAVDYNPEFVPPRWLIDQLSAK